MRHLCAAALALALLAVPAAAQIQVVGSIPKTVPALGATVTSLAAAPASLMSWYCLNTTSAAAYVQVFDAATPGAVTLGTTAPTLSLGLGANQSFGGPLGTPGMAFFNGIQVAGTTLPTNGTGATLVCNFGVAR